MALILIEPVDLYGYNTDGLAATNWFADGRWTRDGVASFAQISNNLGRNDSGAIRLNQSNLTLSRGRATCALGSEFTTLYIGFAFKCQPGTPGGYPVLGFKYGTNYQTCLYVTDTGAIQAKTAAGGSVLGTSDVGVVASNVWQYWEVKVFCDASGTIDVRIDESNVLNLSDIDTQTYNSNGITHIQFANCVDGTTYSYVDDIIIFDATGTSFNDFLGDLAVLGHLMEADTSDKDWSSTLSNHYDAINDVGNGFDTDYIYSNTVSHRDSFTITPNASYPTILAVEIALHGRNSGSGTAKVKPYVKIGVVRYYGAEMTLSAGSTDKRSYIWYKNPATGGGWSKSVVDAAEFGWEVTEIS